MKEAPDTKARARDEQVLSWLSAKESSLSHAEIGRKFGRSKGTISGMISSVKKDLAKSEGESA